MDSSSHSSSNLNHQAIDAALESRWEDAIKLNRQIIKLDPENVDALNRQAKAYLELGKANLAKKYYSLALKFDPYNPIAIKNLKMIKAFKGNGQPHLNGHNGKLSPSLFLQEPGKTKVVTLLKVAEPQKLYSTYCGMPVDMIIKSRKVTILDKEGGYLGVLPDDITHHIVRLIKGGNKYEVFIKSIKVNGLSVLIREIFRSKRFRNQPSFLENHSNSPITEIINTKDFDDSDEVETDEVEEEVVS